MSPYIHLLWKLGPIKNCCGLFNWKILMNRKYLLGVSSDQERNPIKTRLILWLPLSRLLFGIKKKKKNIDWVTVLQMPRKFLNISLI